ncbi:MAG: sialidase family protein [Gammaproteobacteria bacterium]
MKALVLLLSISVLAVPASAREQAGQDGGHMHKAVVDCADAAMLPTVKCAQTVSADFDREGVLWVAWSRGGHVYVQSSSDRGKTFGSPVAVNRTPEDVISHGESRPKIKVDEGGNIYLTWTLKLPKRFSSHIRFSRSTDGGKHFSEPVTVNDNRDVIGHAFDTLAVAGDGKLFIAWLDARDTVNAMRKGQEFEGTALYYTWSDDGGATFQPNRRIAAHTCQCCRLQTAIDRDGLPVVMWRHIFEGGLRDHAIVKFRDWKTPGEFVRMSYENWQIDACPHHGGGLSIGEDGVYHAAWFSNSESKSGLFYGYSSDSGQWFTETAKFGAPGAGHPHVLAKNGRVYLVWQEFDGRRNLVRSMVSEDGGKTWEKPKIAAATEKMADNPFLVDDGERVYLSWQTEAEGYRLIPLADR